MLLNESNTTCCNLSILYTTNKNIRSERSKGWDERARKLISHQISNECQSKRIYVEKSSFLLLRMSDFKLFSLESFLRVSDYTSRSTVWILKVIGWRNFQDRFCYSSWRTNNFMFSIGIYFKSNGYFTSLPFHSSPLIRWFC